MLYWKIQVKYNLCIFYLTTGYGRNMKSVYTSFSISFQKSIKLEHYALTYNYIFFRQTTKSMKAMEVQFSKTLIKKTFIKAP